MGNNTNLERKVTELIEGLPPMPASVDRLLQAAVGRQGADAEERLVRDDSALCFELLHLANSACFVGAAPVETISDAVQRVGLEPLAQAVGARYAQEIIEERFAP